jgi:hypothetical protein
MDREQENFHAIQQVTLHSVAVKCIVNQGVNMFSANCKQYTDTFLNQLTGEEAT